MKGNTLMIDRVYRHFKGSLYVVKCEAIDTTTGNTVVVYKSLKQPSVFYVRPLDEFLSKVDKVKYPEVEQEYRFELVQSKRTTERRLELSNELQ